MNMQNESNFYGSQQSHRSVFLSTMAHSVQNFLNHCTVVNVNMSEMQLDLTSISERLPVSPGWKHSDGGTPVPPQRTKSTQKSAPPEIITHKINGIVKANSCSSANIIICTATTLNWSTMSISILVQCNREVPAFFFCCIKVSITNCR